MTYSIVLTKRAEKQIDALDAAIRDRILSAVKRIRIRPYRYVTKLVGSGGYRLRIGDYRVILDIKQDELIILVIKVGHRRSIYK